MGVQTKTIGGLGRESLGCLGLDILYVALTDFLNLKTGVVRMLSGNTTVDESGEPKGNR
jgi:hypothetical protein